MPSLTQWLQRFVDEVRAPGPSASSAAVLDHSLAAAFVPLPAELPAPAPFPIAGDPLFGPTLATPPRLASSSPLRSASQWPISAQPTAPRSGSAWLSETHAPPAAAGSAAPTPSPTPRSSAGALAALAAAFGNPRAPSRGTPPGPPADNWPTVPRTTPRGAAASLPSQVAAAAPDPVGDGTANNRPLPTGEPTPSDGPGPDSAVLPLAELLRDLVPASPFEARLESLWQQRASTPAGGKPPGGLAAGWTEFPTAAPAVDWSDLARRLADLEAGRAE
jgi:hypothetical protein